MSVRPTEMASASTISPTHLLDLVTRFSTEIGAMTDLGALSERIIQELCRVGGTTHGALYLLDREHEHFRRAGLVGLAAELTRTKDGGAPSPTAHVAPLQNALRLTSEAIAGTWESMLDSHNSYATA